MRFLSEGMRRPNFMGLMTESGALQGDGADVRARDCEGEESQGGAPGGEGQESKEDWVLCVNRTHLNSASRTARPQISARCFARFLKQAAGSARLRSGRP